MVADYQIRIDETQAVIERKGDEIARWRVRRPIPALHRAIDYVQHQAGELDEQPALDVELDLG